MPLVGKGAVVEQGLVKEVSAVLVACTNGVGIPQLVVNVPAMLTAPHEHKGPVPGYLLELARW